MVSGPYRKLFRSAEEDDRAPTPEQREAEPAAGLGFRV